ncbi:hypothetical protein BT63DRAFT_427446 [Microthyrium microscopicum]|uniref:Uncharacterized protein n=1 Tax=Microthyrium microscopicum TaxID=703497 RepID=A0A6A6U6F4_9PEZI|nr:hypothetical protein BT63DRAFT_427446 [Microthyrium microscopicum]
MSDWSENLTEPEKQARGEKPPAYQQQYKVVWSNDHRRWVARDAKDNFFCYVRQETDAGEYRYCWPIPKPPGKIPESHVKWYHRGGIFWCPMEGFAPKGFEQSRPDSSGPPFPNTWYWTEGSNGNFEWKPHHTYDHGKISVASIHGYKLLTNYRAI